MTNLKTPKIMGYLQNRVANNKMRDTVDNDDGKTKKTVFFVMGVSRNGKKMSWLF